MSIGDEKATPPAEKKEAKAVAKKESTLAEFIRSPYMMDQIMVALPKFMTPDRFLRVVHTAMNRTPKLQQCTRASIAMAIMKCAEAGLEPDGRRAHLIPYGTECTLIIDYKGLAELAMRSGTVANIHADKICENDVFKYNRGIIEEHIIDFRKDRGKAYAYYCLVRLKDGSEKAEVMTVSEIDAIRKRSKAGNNGPWVDFYDEMAKKTVFRRASKWITLSPELSVAHELDEEDSLSNKQAVAEFAQLSDSNEIQPADGLAGAVEA